MGEDFRLKWNDHHSVFFSTAESLCHGDHLTDVTLSCGSREFSAHKLVLSICSSYFSQLFAPKPGAKKRPADSAAIVYLKDVDGRHMELLLNYMYRGEINVEESELMGLLATAKGLQIKGLTENDDSETPKEEPRGTPVRSVSRGGASTSNSGVKRPQPSSKNTHIPAPKKIKEESASSSNLHLEAANVSGAAGDHSAEVHEESDYQNAEYLDDTEDIADYSMEDNPGESMVYEGDPNNPGMVYLKSNDDTDDFNHIDAGEFVHYGANNDEFEDLSETRKGIAWKHFWYNKVQDLSKCMHCNQTIKNHGKTKVLLDHLVTAHEFEGIKPDFDCMEFEDISGRKKNEVWKHFLRSTCGEAAKCIHCQKILKTGSKASTSGISYHLSSVHKISITRKKKASMTMMEGHPMMTEASPVKEEASTEAPEYVDVKFETC